MPFLLYGATGYTGTLIAEACAAQKIPVVLGGRSEGPLRALAERLQLPHVVAPLDDTARLERAVADSAAVLHCAGPFMQTSKPMAKACLATKRHYLDITGEMAVFEALHAQTEKAKVAGIVLMPGVGFDVVPSDCMAAHVARALPSATELDLCIVTKGAASHGTTSTVVANLDKGGAVRRGGVIIEEPMAARTRTFVVDGKERVAVSTPWGDVSTAYHSTKIPDITVYFAFPPSVRRAMKLATIARPLLAPAFVRNLIGRFVPKGGPDAEARARGKTYVVAEARDTQSGLSARATLRGPEGYDFTAKTALLAVQRVMSAPPAPGTHTPSTAFGPDFVLEVAGVSRVDG